MTVLLMVAVLFGAVAPAQSARVISGTIVDSSGAPIPDAAVRLEVAGQRLDEVRTATDGRFTFTIQDLDRASIVVSATGFSQVVHPLEATGDNLQITLVPAPFFEEVTVTSTRSDAPRADPTVTMMVFSSSELLTSAPMTIDDALKTVPGFTLFRRTSSRVSNPTAQGIALRGIGGTGASRSLVLADGVPLNDAFGGWVYWDKIPHAAIDRIEVQRGSGSDLYGADAVGGVVQILTVQPGRPMLRGILEGGDQGTGRISVLTGSRSHGWSYSAAGQWFTTDGYVSYAEQQPAGQAPRGVMDTEVGSTHQSALAFLGYQAANGWKIDGRGSVFSEDRKNGTPAQVNDTASRQASARVSGSAGGGLLSASVFGGTQGYDQVFSAVAADRASEDLNRKQFVPTKVFGIGAQWIRAFGGYAWLAGAEGRFINARNQETRLTQGRFLGYTDDGGRQRVGSAFLQATVNPNDRLTVVAGAHADGWHSESRVSPASTLTTPYSKTLGSFNPRVSFAYRVASTGIAVRGSLFPVSGPRRSTRCIGDSAPGDTQTNPNQALSPEKLTGAETGLLLGRGRASARVTIFWNQLDEAITNITLSTTPSLITKQRANADKLRSAGVELEGDLRVLNSLTVGFASAITNARFKGDTSLRDKRVPQVPEYNLGLTLRYADHGWTGSSQLRVTGAQFEDDQNVYTLRPATVLDFYAGRAVTRRAQAFLAIENAFDAVYDVGRTPILTTGLPRTVRGGIQVALP